MSDAGPVLPPGYTLYHLPLVGSTNDEAKSLARNGAPAGTIVWADAQSAGRGRRGREWHSPAGNLYLSLIQRPGGQPAAAAQLSFVTAVALADALTDIASDRAGSSSSQPSGPGSRGEGQGEGQAPRLNHAILVKWPNDVLINGSKVAGILLESETAGDGVIDFVVIGVGVNIAQAPEAPEYPATSLVREGMIGITGGTLLGSFIAAFDARARQWRHDGFPAIRDAWLSRATGIGQNIRVRLDRSTLHGKFVALDQDGALILQAPDGVRRITAGAVFPAA